MQSVSKITSVLEKIPLKFLLAEAIFFKFILLHINKDFCKRSMYSSVRNRRACTFINFEKKIPPAWPYLGLHV